MEDAPSNRVKFSVNVSGAGMIFASLLKAQITLLIQVSKHNKDADLQSHTYRFNSPGYEYQIDHLV